MQLGADGNLQPQASLFPVRPAVMRLSLHTWGKVSRTVDEKGG